MYNHQLMRDSSPASPDRFKPGQRWKADCALLFVSVIWGSAFVAQRIAAGSSSVFLFNGLRFLLAGIVILPFAWIVNRKAGNRQNMNKSGITGVLIAGVFLTCGAALQQAGLRYTTAGNAGFITGLYVVLIPIILTIFLKSAPYLEIWIAAILAVCGLFLLSTGGRFAIQFGDMLELGGAIFWALHVIWISRIVQRVELLQLAAGQYLVCAILSISLGIIIEPNLSSVSSETIWAIVYTGIVSVALGYTLQVYGQKASPPADAAILLSMESVFAAIFGWIILNEVLSPVQIIGCGMILSGMLFAQSRAWRRAKLRRDPA